MFHNLITILGPTATGKTRLAAKLANKFNGEIISADSRQVYIGMDIGTGKDFDDYKIGSKQIPFHLIDVIDSKEEFDLFKFQNLFYKFFDDILQRMKTPFLVGGTGMYLSSILQNYKLNKAEFSEERTNKLRELSLTDLQNKLKILSPSLHNTTDSLEKERVIRALIIAENSSKKERTVISVQPLVIGISLPRDVIKKRITKRLKQRLDNGMIEEVKSLFQSGVTYEKLYFFGLEYKYIGMYLKRELTYNDMFQKLNSAIHSFAKRQMTWFRKMEKEGVMIHWIDGPDYESASELIKKIFPYESSE